jgi:hypothetical protein
VPTPDIQPHRLVALSDDECWDLLRSHGVGRIAWSGAEGMSVVPVNYLVDGDAIRIRTTPYSLLARDGGALDVAFEVDDIDPERHLGWSVLARGRSERDAHAPTGPRPWATGSRVLALQIRVRSLSGRRLVSVDPARS